MIDREIQDALQVDPSPEFVARVRTRIASEPAPSGWRWSWTVAATGLCAAAILAAFVMLRPPAATAVVAPSQVAHESATPLQAPGASQQATLVPVVSPAIAALKPRVAVAAEAEPSRAATEPEFLLDPAETRALQKLIAGARSGRADLTPLAGVAPSAPMEFQRIDNIVIAPIIIEPLAPQGAQGERQ